MNIKNKRKLKNGLTLLEILVAIVIMTGTLMAFAMSFPAAFQVTRKANNAVRAAKLASGVADELRALATLGTRTMVGFSNENKAQYIEAFESNGSYSAIGDGKNLMANNSICSYLKSVQAMKEIGNLGVKNLSKYGNCFFSLDGAPNIPGISVRHTGSHNTYADSQFWEIVVTVSWPENVSARKSIRKSVTVVSAKTGNRW
ncbi:type II secretion system protein [bacterium]|nr:type II secretion system protein [bacterium]